MTALPRKLQKVREALQGKRKARACCQLTTEVIKEVIKSRIIDWGNIAVDEAIEKLQKEKDELHIPKNVQRFISLQRQLSRSLRESGLGWDSIQKIIEKFSKVGHLRDFEYTDEEIEAFSKAEGAYWKAVSITAEEQAKPHVDALVHG